MKNLQKHLAQLQQLQMLPEQKHSKSINAATPASIKIKTEYNILKISFPFLSISSPYFIIFPATLILISSKDSFISLIDCLLRVKL
jgi:hypothetical protein